MAKKYRALVKPRKNTKDYAGMCLRFAQSFFGAKADHRSAWHAWLAQKHKHGPNVPLPNAPVLLWFSHWGTYNDELGQYGSDPRRPYYGNWGHVTPFVPGDAIYSSPWYIAYGQERYSTIGEIERIFGAKYVGWSEDINGLRVAEPVPVSKPKPKPKPKPDKDIEMRTIYNINDKNEATRRAAVGEFTFQVQRDAVSTRERKLWGAPVNVTQGEWNAIIATVNVRRKMIGLDPISGKPGEFFSVEAGDKR